MRVLVTGGAGYIGSHVVKALGEAGHTICICDNLSTGHRKAILYGDLAEGDLADRSFLKRLMRDFRPEVVMHFAALIEVGQSVREPLKYYRNNIVNTLNLLEAMTVSGVKNLIFSSSAAVYGIPEKIPVDEESPLLPISPYGSSKMTVEGILKELFNTGNLEYVSLRYFNVAGADGQGRIGQMYREAPHLITKALKTAKGEFRELSLYGTDYPTPDGTCIRDYIHVDDLAEAHILALEHLMKAGGGEVYNCGYGSGFSVREVVDATKRVTGVDFQVEEKARRAGDPPLLVSDSAKIRRVLGWRPRHDDLEYIIGTAWEWEKRRPLNHSWNEEQLSLSAFPGKPA